MDRTPASAATPRANALPPGTRLGEFEVLDLLGVGGFGIVYRALDHALEREVAIKEYMPAMLAGRTETLHVSLRSQSDAEVFEAGRRSFVNEAKLLARFDHPSLVKVYRFWEANDTAYMAMPIYRGRTLRDVRLQMESVPEEGWLRALLAPLLSALERLHAEGVYHRDIAPDNILIEPDGRPVLLDFGAARRVIGDRSQNLTAILKPAYAPIEQYAEASAARQGPWTDLYALGATLHFALLGHAPPPATTRMLHDDLLPLATRGLAGCSPAFLQAVDWMLAPRPSDRPQSVAQLRAALDGGAEVPRSGPSSGPAHAPAPGPAPASWDATRLQASGPAEALSATMIDLPVAEPAPPPPAAPGAVPQSRPGAVPPATWEGDPGARRWIPAALGALVIGGAAVFWWASRAPAPAPVAGPAASAPVAAASEAAPAASRAEATPSTVPAASSPAARAAPARPLPAPATATPPAPSMAGGPRPPPSTEPASLPRPVAEALPAAAASAAPMRPAAVASAPAAPPPAASLSDDPSALCGKRVLVSQLICMERECRKPELAQHPACKKWYTQSPRQQP